VVVTATLTTLDRGSGTRLVLLPWFSLGKEVMAAAFEPAVADIAGLRRTYVDLPGVGGSAPVSPAAPSTDAVVDTIVDLLTTAGGPVVLAGCSYGGYVAAAVARRRPDLVSALALVCSGVRISLQDRTLPDIAPRAPLVWADDVEPWIRTHLELALGTHDVAVADRVARLVGASSNDEGYLTSLREHGYQVADEHDTRAYEGPVLMLAGRQDRIAGYSDQFEAMARYPHGTYAAVDGAGHYLPFEQPDAFRGLVEPWLVDVLGSQGRAPSGT
jgi:pimeloyl-ACP methyl ester carboxylesterase